MLGRVRRQADLIYIRVHEDCYSSMPMPIAADGLEFHERHIYTM